MVVPKWDSFILGGILWEGGDCVKSICDGLPGRRQDHVFPIRKRLPLTDFRFGL
jgi:hypothetical protein